jgi:hypothetical protein
MVSLSGLFFLGTRLRVTDVWKEHAPGWGDRLINRPAWVFEYEEPPQIPLARVEDCSNLSDEPE